MNTLSIDQITGSDGNSESGQGIFFAIPGALAQSIAHALIGQAQSGGVTQLAAIHLRPRMVALSTVAFTVPHDWLVNRLSRTALLASTRDQLAQVRISYATLKHGQSLDTTLRRLIRLPHSVKIATVRLSGRSGRQVVLTSHKKGAASLWLTVLPDKARGRVVVVQVSERAGTTTGDRRQVASVLASLHISR